MNGKCGGEYIDIFWSLIWMWNCLSYDRRCVCVGGGVASNCRWGPRHQYVISAPVCHGQHGVSLKRSLSPESSVRRHTQCCVNGWWVWVQFDPPYTVLCEWVVGVGAIWPTLHSAVWMGGGCGCNMTHPTQWRVNGWWVWVQYDPPYTVLCEWVVGVGAIWPTLHSAVWMGGGCGCNLTHPTQCCVNAEWTAESPLHYGSTSFHIKLTSFHPVVHDWQIKGLGMSSRASEQIPRKDPVPLIVKE